MLIAVPLRAWVAFLAGLAVQAATYWSPDLFPASVAHATKLVAAGLLVYGGAVVAERKGYSSWVGMTGLLSAVGVVIMIMLPPRDALPKPWRRSVLPKDDHDRRDEPREPTA